MASSSLSVALLLCLAAAASAQLSPPTYYDVTCRDALSTIKSMVTTAVGNDPRMGASLLRLHFHDCFVQGCDASVLLNTTGTEQNAPGNVGSLRGMSLIEDIKKAVEDKCDRNKNTAIVSCADILAVAARDSVVALGGPSWTVKLGRKDSLMPSPTTDDLPPPFFSVDQLADLFARKGFNDADMVALSGAHTIGRVQCQNFKNRLYNEANFEPTYAASLRPTCPQAQGPDDTRLFNLDAAPPSPDTFDNGFFVGLKQDKGLLHSDQVLYSGGAGRTDSIVTRFADNPADFSTAFASAMVKMGDLVASPPTLLPGQIRRYCYKAN